MVADTVFLFPGQGSQFPGMTADLYQKYDSVKHLFTRASEVCGSDMAALLFDGSEEQLKATENSQTAIVLASLAAREALGSAGVESSAAAGHSLGEYSALVDAGTLSVEDALCAVSERGRHMAAATASIEAEKGPVGMAAVIGIGPSEVRRALEGLADVWSANENGPSQVVIAGTRDGMNAAEDALKAAGARRVIPLKVSGPFHTPLMKDAADALAETLSGLDFKNPMKLVWSNVHARPIENGEQARELLVRQITGSVLWANLTMAVAAKNPARIYEVGPGKVLCGLWAKSGLNGKCLPAGSVGDLDVILPNSNQETKQAAE